MKFFFVIVILWLNPVWSAECQDFRFQETHFTACTAELPKDDVRLFLKDKTKTLEINLISLNATKHIILQYVIL